MTINDKKLSELLRLSKSSDAGLDGETMTKEVKRKYDVLKELKRTVKRLQSEEAVSGAIEVPAAKREI
ncbi:hypothetical protein U1Q18_031558 [Sarracenia purpurea var. burkii]